MSKTYFIELTEMEVECLQVKMVRESVLTKLEETLKPRKDLLITHKEYKNIVSLAKSEWVKLPKDLRISNKETDERDLVHISLASALILWLNKNNLLKNFVGFDFTDHSNEYDTIED